MKVDKVDALGLILSLVTTQLRYWGKIYAENVVWKKIGSVGIRNYHHEVGICGSTPQVEHKYSQID